MVLGFVAMIYSFVEMYLVKWSCWVVLGICQGARIIPYGCLLVSRFNLKHKWDLDVNLLVNNIGMEPVIVVA
jgi:hypothetical protein